MKKILIFVFATILTGALFALIIFKSYEHDTKAAFLETNVYKIYLLQIGAYEKEENVYNVTKVLPNYYVEKNGELYHIYIGVTKSKETANFLKAFYKNFGNNIYIKEKSINNKELYSLLDEYEPILIKQKNNEVIYSINKELLNKYENVTKTKKGN